MPGTRCQWITGLLCLLLASSPRADSLRLATAANFRPALEALVHDFNPGGEHAIRISSASTGVLYSQVMHGAPFDMLLAADSLRPQRLEAEGRIVPGSRHTYARGELVLVYREPLSELAQDGLAAVLAQPGHSLAIANPELAPYGEAAMAVLARPEFSDARPRLLRGANILQAYQMFHSGGADSALVARSLAGEHFIPIPPDWHLPLDQQVVIIKQPGERPLASAFLDYLLSSRAAAIIENFGYQPGDVRGD